MRTKKVALLRQMNWSHPHAIWEPKRLLAELQGVAYLDSNLMNIIFMRL